MGPSDRPPSFNKDAGPTPRPEPIPPVIVDSPANSANEAAPSVHPLPPPPSTAPGPDANDLAIIQEMIRRTEKANATVRKYNAAKKLLREDRRRTEPVSDDEQEDPMPDITLFIRTNATPSIVVTSPLIPTISTASATSGESIVAPPGSGQLLTIPPAAPGQLPPPTLSPPGPSGTGDRLAPPHAQPPVQDTMIPASPPNSTSPQGDATLPLANPNLDDPRARVVLASRTRLDAMPPTKPNTVPEVVDFFGLPPLFSTDTAKTKMPMRVTSIPNQIFRWLTISCIFPSPR
jgi:hypothetical protein